MSLVIFWTLRVLAKGLGSIACLFSKKGCPYDNACIESFHAALKKEEVYTTKYSDYNSAKIAIFKYIEGWYNTRRIHSSINYMTPNECERLARSKTV